MSFYANYYMGINVGIEICCVIVSSIILIAVQLKESKNRATTAFTFFVITFILAMASDAASYLIYSRKYQMMVVAVTACITYSMICMSMYGFYSYLRARTEVYYGVKYSLQSTVWALGYSAFLIAFFMSSLWTGVIFSVTPEGVYMTGSHPELASVLMFPLLIGQIIATIRNIRQATVMETVTFLAFLLVFAGMGIIDAIYVTVWHYVAITVFIIYIYIMIELEQEKTLGRKQRELAISELNALRLQMNPHYIYNVLASIDGLILLDPSAARGLVGKFIKHLRGSYLDDMPERVNIQTELTNLKYYLAVEETRFPNIKMKLDIQADDFEIPPLVIQPMVENAVKNGICGKEDSSGTITICTYETPTTYDVVVRDDGVGYDVNEVKNDGRHHVGVVNTRKRLELICNGRLEINSIVGLGTEAHIIIPKE